MPHDRTKVIDSGKSDDVIGLGSGRSHGADSFDVDKSPSGYLASCLYKRFSTSNEETFFIC